MMRVFGQGVKPRPQKDKDSSPQDKDSYSDDCSMLRKRSSLDSYENEDDNKSPHHALDPIISKDLGPQSSKAQRLYDSFKAGLGTSNPSEHQEPSFSPKVLRKEGGQQLLDSLSGKMDGLLEVVFQRSSSLKVGQSEINSRETVSFSFRGAPSRGGEKASVNRKSPPKTVVPDQFLLKAPVAFLPVASFHSESVIKQTHTQAQPFSPHIQDLGIQGYAAATDQGLVREYNEDRISIVMNIAPRDNLGENHWPHSSFFAVYDGHGGSGCPDYLRDNLHKLVVQSEHFPNQPQTALNMSFEQAERTFMAQAMSNPDRPDISGSCAVVALVVDDLCYIANLGDSRVVASLHGGAKTRGLTTDMKPSEESEQMRIVEAGGRVYQTICQSVDPITKLPSTIYGPLRVLPGRLSISRSFGDIEAKDLRFGGKPGVVVAEPVIEVMPISKDLDFLILASDGIFDKLENEEAVEYCWKGIEKAFANEAETLEQVCLAAAEELMSRSFALKTQDNISVVVVSFKSLTCLKKAHQQHESQKQLHERLNNMLKKSRASPKESPLHAARVSRLPTGFSSRYI